MSINILETEWWSLALPPEWWAEAQEESILVGDHDGVGCIEISTLHKETGAFDPATVEQIVREESDPQQVWKSASLGPFKGLTSSYVEEEAAIREWYVALGGMLLFVTYSCEEENRGMDDAAVDEILDTLEAL
ncbi:hypothetical protein GCM10007052_09960 [Halioglobus japonicus]|uniref:hypothetical protein n=1 Tax=Halioglobus TaxID=1217416 RepID=UPI0019A14C15|nr:MULTISPECIES: hypothetical protein [Halioglobus]GHD10558.1 hypothetical protein GCM10007052_09960 [Halioglobus japonicus]